MRDQWSVNVTYSPSSPAIKPVVLFSFSSPTDPLTPPGVSIRHTDLQRRSRNRWMNSRPGDVRGKGGSC